MALLHKLRQAINYLRKLRLSLGPDSYFQYKRRRVDARHQAEEANEHAAKRDREEAEHGRQNAAREREYDERYERERRADLDPEQGEQRGPEP